MKFLVPAIAGLCVLTSIAQAGELIDRSFGAATCPGHANVKIPDTGMLNLPSGAVKVNKYAVGIRKDPFLGADRDIYCLTVLGADDKAPSKSDPVGGLMNMKAFALHLDFVFLFAVSGGDIRGKFSNGLSANAQAAGINMADPAVANFLAVVGKASGAHKGDWIDIGFDNTAASTIYYRDPAGVQTPIPGSPALLKAVISIWFGNIVGDNDLSTLKGQLLDQLTAP